MTEEIINPKLDNPIICFIQQGSSGPINIGYTQLDPNHRLLTLQKANPEKLNLLGCIEGTPEKATQLHNFFQSFRLYGDWFRPDPSFLNCILNLILNKELSIENVKEIKYNAFIGTTISTARKMVIEQFESTYISDLLSRNKGKIDVTARMAGISTRQLHKLMRKYDIKKDTYK